MFLRKVPFTSLLSLQTPKKTILSRFALKSAKLPEGPAKSGSAGRVLRTIEGVHAEYNFFATKNFRRANEIWVSEESESTVEKEKVNKSTIALHGEWSNEKITLQKLNFSKTPRFALKPSKLPEGPFQDESATKATEMTMITQHEKANSVLGSRNE